MNQAIIEKIARLRPLLYHFTRVANLESIIRTNRLMSAKALDPLAPGERRTHPVEVGWSGGAAILNSHLRIADSMMADGISQEEFRSWLNRHVFFWPTARDCRQMLEVYRRREPNGRFCVLALDTRSLLSAHYAAVRLTKYDSGSSPRFPHRCSYRKSPEMFLPLDRFGSSIRTDTPASVPEIKEVLVDGGVTGVAQLLRTVHVQAGEKLPSGWSHMRRPLEEL
ncbi:MAG: hypothetical protein K0Q90_1056 [Paenibacillaceae bacterium]|nr:hypothetical protein [Paenibacillaceae bacterium]